MYYNFTKFHQDQIKTKKVFIIAYFFSEWSFLLATPYSWYISTFKKWHPMGNFVKNLGCISIFPNLKVFILHYFFWSETVWTWAVGWKSTAMCKISTKPNQVIMLQAIPIRCPNPQPRVVKNLSQQLFFLEKPNVHRYLWKYVDRY